MHSSRSLLRYSRTRPFATYDVRIRETDPPLQRRSIPASCRLLARNTRLLRVMHGWSQEQLALEAGLDRSFVGAIERAERNLTFASAEKIAHAFDMDVVELLTLQL